MKTFESKNVTIVHNDDELSFAACREGGAGHTTCDWSSGEATQFTFFRFDTFDTSA